MPTGILIGIGSGLASAVLAYSAVRGNVLLKLVLFILTPLPVLIAGLGWGVVATIAGALAGAAIMTVAGGPALGLTFLLVLGIPAMLVAWLADLGRPSADGLTTDWFPAGGILAAFATYGGLIPVFFAPFVGGSYTTLKPQMLPFVTRAIKQMQAQFGATPLTEAQIDAFTDVMIAALPASIAAYWVLLFAINVYLAGRIALASGRLVRPWPDLHALLPPPWLALALAATMVLSMLSGGPRMLGSSMTGALIVAFMLYGLSVIHAVSHRRVPWMLWVTYAGLLNPAGPYATILVALLGLLEPLLNLRKRLAKPPIVTGT